MDSLLHNDSKYFITSIFIITFILIFTSCNSAYSKSFYKDGNYSEALGSNRMCMRCHMGTLNPTNTGLRLEASRTTISAGDTITVFATISGFSKQWNPGLGLFVDINSQYAVHTPQEYGWVMVDNSNGNNFNYFRIGNSTDTLFYWKLRAPSLPGYYRIMASGYFSDLSTGSPVQGTKRGDNSLVLNVVKSNNGSKPVLTSVEGKYRNFIFLNFTEPVDSSFAANISNYKITNVNENQALSINDIHQSRNRKQVILKTGDQAAINYSISINNISDYSDNPISYDTTASFIPDLNIAYRIRAEWSQDVTSSELGQSDMTEFLGNQATDIYRVNLCFPLPDSPIDLLPIMNFKSAKLCLIPKSVAKPNVNQQEWDVYKLLPGSDWNDYVGNNQSVQENWSGYNQAENPASSIIRNVPVNIDTVNNIWSWDITNDFRERFRKLGGTVTNQSDYFLRIRANVEDANTGGIGFYGSDAELQSNIPYIQLEFDSSYTYVNEELNDLQNFDFENYPNPATESTTINISGSSSINYTFEMYDFIGNRVRNAGIQANQNSFSLDLRDLNTGLYFLKLISGRNVLVKNIVKVN